MTPGTHGDGGRGRSPTRRSTSCCRGPMIWPRGGCWRSSSRRRLNEAPRDPGRRTGQRRPALCATRCCGRSPTIAICAGSSPAAWPAGSRPRGAIWRRGAGAPDESSGRSTHYTPCSGRAARRAARPRAPELVADLAERLALVCDRLRRPRSGRRRARAARRRRGRSAPARGASGRRRSTAKDVDAADRRPPRCGPPRRGPLWVRRYEDEIDRAAGSPLSLLLAELEDAERIAAAESAAACHGSLRRFRRGRARRRAAPGHSGP